MDMGNRLAFPPGDSRCELQVRIPFPFTPVRLTGKTLGVFLLADALGSRCCAFTRRLEITEGVDLDQ